jgi:hypothetical protein
MGSGSSMESTQTELKEKCRICLQQPEADCTWHPGRCPHRMNMLDRILADSYRSRFYNLLRLFTGRQ